jgi:hypothetical protein
MPKLPEFQKLPEFLADQRLANVRVIVAISAILAIVAIS